VPGGVVNLLSGRRAELAPVLASHHAPERDRQRLGRPTRRRHRQAGRRVGDPRRAHAASTDYAAATADPLSRLEALTELKTAWHPVGA
jgi:aldehyde dehydrogenase (NAD+)